MSSPFWSNGVSTLYHADAMRIPLPDRSVHMAVTSPPYWGLRDYGLSAWDGGYPECEHEGQRLISGGNTSKQNTHAGSQGTTGDCVKCGATQQVVGIGLEPTLGEWVQNIVAVSREVWRVLRDDGTFWLNLGDAYAGSGKGHAEHHANPGLSKSFERGGDTRWKQDTNRGSSQVPRNEIESLPAKNLMGQPWRVAFALQDDGWILRSAIVWHKPNPMPESAQDRPTSAYEMVFLLSKQARYFYDGEAIRQPNASGPSDIKKMIEGRERIGGKNKVADDPYLKASAATNIGQHRAVGDPSGANIRNVWSISTKGYPGAHFATFPEELPRRCILAGTSEKGVCAECGAPWSRMVGVSYENPGGRTTNGPRSLEQRHETAGFDVRLERRAETTGWEPTCDCGAGVVPATVLDPFAGSGTTLAVAQSLGRRSIGLDLSEKYLALAAERIGKIPLPLNMT